MVTEDAENAVEDFHRLVPDMARKVSFGVVGDNIHGVLLHSLFPR